MIAQARRDLRAQATPDDRRPERPREALPQGPGRATSTATPSRITEADALIAYLQVLGTLVDFKLYDDKANIR